MTKVTGSRKGAGFFQLQFTAPAARRNHGGRKYRPGGPRSMQTAMLSGVPQKGFGMKLAPGWKLW